MAKSRYPGYKGTVYVDPAGGVVYVQVYLARNIQLPPRQKSSVDVSGLEDEDAQTIGGQGSPSQFSFTIMWDPQDTNDAALIALYTSGAKASWKATITDGTTNWSQTWKGWVKEIVPQPFGASDPVTATIIGERTSDITDAFT